MDPVPIMCGCLSWSSTIGLFLINCGTLDYLVFVFLKDNLAPREFATFQKRGLRERIEGITLHLIEANYPEAEQVAFANWAERFQPIRELRNHLAHGHMYARIHPETQKPTLTVFQAKDLDTGWLPDSQHVEFAKLQSGLKTLGELIEEFQRLAGFKTAGGATSGEDLKG